jgi:hypothetical protein
MALLGKERVMSPTLNIITVGISITVTDLTANLAKILILEIVKPEPFYRSR